MFERNPLVDEQPAVPDEPPPGTWRVVDPDGNVIESGETIHLQMAATMGEQGESDGSD